MTLGRLHLRLAAVLSIAALSPALQAQDAAALRAAAHAYRTSHEGAIAREYAELLAIPNLASDRANIRRNADQIVAMLAKRGVVAQLLEVPDAPPAVFGELKSPGATHTIVLYAHYDGQPVDPTQWVTPPWSPTLRDKALFDGGVVIPFPATDSGRIDGEARLYARSTGDDKGSILAMLTALDAMRAANLKPSINIKFFFEGEEEAGSPHLRQILEKYHDLLASDGWLFCDGPNHQSGRQQVQFGARGVTGLELTVYGPTRPLHSGHYGNWAPNPGALMANLIASMRDDDGLIKITGYYADVRPITAAERKAIAALPPIDSSLRRSLGLARTEANDAILAERIMRPALNVRGIRVGAVGAQAANVISTEARASFDFRLVPNQTPAHVQELVNTHLRKQGYFVTSDSVTMAMRLAHAKVAHVEWDAGGYPASRAPMDLPMAQAVLRAVADGAGQMPLAVPTVGGSGPTYLFEQVLKVPVLALPIANYDNNQHAANENMRMQNLYNGIEMYTGLM
ncbi:MAG: M20/M25/M40 family metallo-hydrolase, partial [Gemmatimonadota bacterium]|nr:M20/M25/M40 family metallo-hydrolase [Gemmatimonadota bacterium]